MDLTVEEIHKSELSLKEAICSKEQVFGGIGLKMRNGINASPYPEPHPRGADGAGRRQNLPAQREKGLAKFSHWWGVGQRL